MIWFPLVISAADARSFSCSVAWLSLYAASASSCEARGDGDLSQTPHRRPDGARLGHARGDGRV
jgi:hypothetical protein